MAFDDAHGLVSNAERGGSARQPLGGQSRRVHRQAADSQPLIRYPEFLGSLKAGKAEADVRVECSLYQRAVGYSYDVPATR